jgi:hypothetical protein
LLKKAKIGCTYRWNVRVNVTFARYVYAKNAKNPPKIVHTNGKNFVAIVKKCGSKVIVVVQPKNKAFPQNGVPTPRNISAPK